MHANIDVCYDILTLFYGGNLLPYPAISQKLKQKWIERIRKITGVNAQIITCVVVKKLVSFIEFYHSLN